MKRSGYLRLLLLSVFAALILSAISLLFLNRLADEGASRPRGDFLIFITDAVEQNVRTRGDKEIRSLKSLLDFDNMPWPPPPPPESAGGRPPKQRGFGGPGGPPPPFGRRPSPPGSNLDTWLVREDGNLLYQAKSDEGTLPLPVDWSTFEKPQAAHEMRTQADFFRLTPSIHVIKLETTSQQSPRYLVVRDRHRPFYRPLFITQAILSFATLAASLFFSLSLTFYYLRKKSNEARKILLRLEQGDLKARFDLQRFDEFGGLMLDFNRMAQEIEKLVSRLHATEATRSNLLQELGHDLRTPLTSLTTSFETLRMHFTKMSEEDRGSVFEMINAEISYFTELLDKLMTIATLDEPNYKKSTELIDVSEVLRQELKVRQSSSTALTWSLRAPSTSQAPLVVGDAHLILRLFKNAFDNAARYAKTQIQIEVLAQQSDVIIRIQDDGPGLSIDDLKNFGTRRENRARRAKTGAGMSSLNFSLGLGSVIMKSIVELHEGQLQIENAPSSGACLMIRLARASESKNESPLP